jgi:hypothetical protein
MSWRRANRAARALHRRPVWFSLANIPMSTRNQTAQSSTAVNLSDEDGVRQIVSGAIFDLWKVVNSLTRLKASTRTRYRVAIFGSARAQPGSFVYDEVKRLAAAFAAMGCDVVTGGGPGLMQAANAGAASVGREMSMGIRIELPFEERANPYVEHDYEHQTFFTRLHHFVLASDAFVVVPGGIGTVLELLMIWQLLQVEHVVDAPLILIGKMWRGLVSWASENMLDPRLQLASPGDLQIPQCVDSADDAIAAIRDRQAAWLEQRDAQRA